MAAWGAWRQKHHGAIVDPDGTLGETRQVSREGVSDFSNELAAFIVVPAPSHEAALKRFDHPSYTIFPDDAVDAMPLCPFRECEEF